MGKADGTSAEVVGDGVGRAALGELVGELVGVAEGDCEELGEALGDGGGTNRRPGPHISSGSGQITVPKTGGPNDTTSPSYAQTAERVKPEP